MEHIFISHVEEDADIALPLASELEAGGYPTWYYERDSVPGPSYLTQVSRAIAAVAAVVVVISPSSLRSWQVEKEVVQAHEHGKPFVPLLRDITHGEFRVTRPDWAMAIGAATAHPISLASVPAVLRRLLDGLRLLIGAGRTTTPTPQAPQPRHLPAPRTSLIGREEAVSEALALLRDGKARLLTITGMGGIGKTQVAIRIAHELLPVFPDGVYFVSLASVHEPAEVVPAIANALGVKEDGALPLRESVQAFLRDRPALLLLDNYEQVLSAASVVADLLDACPRLTALVTSRERLRLRGEREAPLTTLEYPNSAHPLPCEAIARYPAVALFVERARDIRPEFALTDENARAVAAICARLDGLPLAIELAAAWIRLLPPHKLLGRLKRRLPLLTGGSRDLPERQQTLRAAIDWSYNLLDARERELLARLAVFVDGWTLDAAEAVCGDPDDEESDVLAALAALLDKSMAQASDAAAEEQRFILLETIREYALERLDARGEGESLRARHAAYYLALAEGAEPQLRGAQQSLWFERLEREHGNVRAALQWACASGDDPTPTARVEMPGGAAAAPRPAGAGDAAKERLPGRGEVAMRLAGALWWFWLTRGHLSEGQRWFDAVLARYGNDGLTGGAAVRAKVWRGAGALAWSQGDHERAEAWLERGLALYRDLHDDASAALTLLVLGNMARDDDDYARATAVYEEGLGLYRGLGDAWGTAVALTTLGNVALDTGDHEQATRRYEEALPLSRAIGDTWNTGNLLGNLGTTALYRGDYDRAKGLYEESLALRRELADAWGIAITLHNLGELERRFGDPDRSATLHRQSLRLFRDLGRHDGIAACLEGIAATGVARGQAEGAARLFGAASVVRRAHNITSSPDEQADHDRAAAAVRAALGDDAWAKAWHEGELLSQEQVVAMALASPDDAAGGTPPVGGPDALIVT